MNIPNVSSYEDIITLKQRRDRPRIRQALLDFRVKDKFIVDPSGRIGLI